LANGNVWFLKKQTKNYFWLLCQAYTNVTSLGPQNRSN
jgi:hypothetical protein